MSRKKTSLIAAAAMLAATTAAAQAPPKNVRGEVVALTADRISVRPDTGPTLDMRLAPEWSVQVMRPLDLEKIPPGSFVGAIQTPVAGATNTGRAYEVHQFLPGVRMGDGHLPWDRPAGSTMTSGDIGPVTRTADGHAFDLALATGRHRILVPAGTPVVLINNEGREHIKVGVRVFILAWPEADGSLRVDAVATGPDGTAPPL